MTWEEVKDVLGIKVETTEDEKYLYVRVNVECFNKKAQYMFDLSSLKDSISSGLDMNWMISGRIIEDFELTKWVGEPIKR